MYFPFTVNFVHPHYGFPGLFHFAGTYQKTGRFAEEQDQSDARKGEQCQDPLEPTPTAEEVGDDAEKDVVGGLNRDM